MTLDAVLKKQLADEVASQLDGLQGLYRYLHANPELSGQEQRTAERLAEAMRRLGLMVHTGLGGHGVAGVLDNGPGPVVLLRADMDALPLVENTGLPFASTATARDEYGRRVGVMHACGHDVHMTCLIGAAAVLTRLKGQVGGKVIFVAQPDEEVHGGARLMVEAGLYEKTGRPDFCVALHVRSELAAGCVGLAAGVRSTAAHALDITIRGRGGHGAAPHQTVDPIVLAAQFVLALQTIVSRQVDPSKMGLITVGAIHGGAKRNIIPETVELNLTLRAYEDEVIAQLRTAIERTANGLAQAAGLAPDRWPVIRTAETPYPRVYNDPALTERLRVVFADLLGGERVLTTPAGTGSEDFGYFGLTDPPIPTVMFHLGATDPDRLARSRHGDPRIAPEHDPGFQPHPETCLPTGVTTMAAAALGLLAPALNPKNQNRA